MIDYYEITRATTFGTVIERTQYPSMQAALGAFPRQLVLGPDDDGRRVVRLLAREGEYVQTLIKAEVNLRTEPMTAVVDDLLMST
jgi:hypothetical protein